MNLAARHQPGVPTTPPPRKPAPNPRYNDLTRPRSLQMDAEHRELQAHAPSVDWRGHFWGSTPESEPAQQQQQQQQQQRQRPGLFAGEANLNLCRSTKGGGAVSSSFFERQRQATSSLSDPTFPLPWQGKIDLPTSDEEIMNDAQTWITQILHENGENLSDDGNETLSTDVLLNGRVLCRVANGIAAGSVEAVFEDEPDNTRNMRSFLVACRRLGVPAGALFDTVEPDPRCVGLCLHVLSAVVRDTVPEFEGPFLATGPSGFSSPITAADDGGEVGEDDDVNRPRNSDNSNNSNSIHRNPQSNDVLKEQAEPATGRKTLQHRSSRQTTAAAAVNIDFSPSAEERDSEYSQQCQQQQEQDQRYQGCHQQHAEPLPPAPPAARPRPLSFPSRFLPAAPAEEDAMWNSLFPSPTSMAPAGGSGTSLYGNGCDGAGGVGNRDAAAIATWCTAEEVTAEPTQEQARTSESLTITALPPPGVVSAATLSAWLSNLNLGAFQGALASIGVETMGDLRYLEEQDLFTIGMHGPQIRKLLQNRP